MSVRQVCLKPWSMNGGRTVFIARLLSFLDCNFKVIAVLKKVLVMKRMSSERAAMTVLPERWGKLEQSCLLSSQSYLRAM